MTIPFWCVLASALLPYLVKLPMMVAMSKLGGYNNRHPRDQQAKLTGWGRRAVAAHHNCFESLAVFTACVFIAQFRGADVGRVSLFAVAYVILRVIYVGLYLADFASLRSLTWFAAVGCCALIAFA